MKTALMMLTVSLLSATLAFVGVRYGTPSEVVVTIKCEPQLGLRLVAICVHGDTTRCEYAPLVPAKRSRP